MFDNLFGGEVSYIVTGFTWSNRESRRSRGRRLTGACAFLLTYQVGAKSMTQGKNGFFVDPHAINSSRKILLFNLRDVVFETEIAGLVPGEFPIDAWHPLLLEVPEGGSKAHISGRFPAPVSSSMSRVEWDKSRVVNLPIYEKTKRYRQENLRGLGISKEFPSMVPVVTVANRYDGYYCDQRRAQAVSVFAVWADGTSLLLEVDWCEGSLEDCITPEWHLRSSPRLPVKDGVDRLKGSCRNPPMWEDCSFYLYVIPPFLGSYLLGRGKRTPSTVWQQEWRYSEHAEMMRASDRIITTIMEREIVRIN